MIKIEKAENKLASLLQIAEQQFIGILETNDIFIYFIVSFQFFLFFYLHIMIHHLVQHRKNTCDKRRRKKEKEWEKNDGERKREKRNRDRNDKDKGRTKKRQKRESVRKEEKERKEIGMNSRPIEFGTVVFLSSLDIPTIYLPCTLQS